MPIATPPRNRLLFVAALSIVFVPMAAQADHVPDAPAVTDVSFQPGHGPQWGAAKLTGNSGLQFSGARVCLQTGVGCPDAVRQISAGEGLAASPDPIVSEGTLALNLNGGADQSCLDDQKVRGISATGILDCVPDPGATGDITAVKPGPGLTGGGVSGDVQLSVATDGVTTGMIQDGTIGSADIDPSQVQRRVAGSCGTGTAIRAIAYTGGVSCRDVGTENIVAAFRDLGPSGTSLSSSSPRQVGSTTITAPTAGFLVIAGMVHVNAVLGSDTMGLHPKVDGNEVTATGWAATAFIDDEDMMHYTITTSVSAGTHTVTQELHGTDGGMFYIANGQHLSAMFFGSGSLN